MFLKVALSGISLINILSCLSVYSNNHQYMWVIGNTTLSIRMVPIFKNLIGSQVIVFRLVYCLSTLRTSEDGLNQLAELVASLICSEC